MRHGAVRVPWGANRQWHRLGKLEHELHVLPHRHGERAGVSDGCLVVYDDVSAIEYRTAVPARNILSPTQRQRSVPPRRDAW